MSDTSVRTDPVDVEQIMQQLRARIRERRGADYTEAELQQLASAKLGQLFDTRGVRADLAERFWQHRVPSPEPPTYQFEDTTLYETHRGLLRGLRKLLRPILKLFINPDPLSRALHIQAQVNAEFHRRFRLREEMDPILIDVIRSLVVDVTRAGLEVQSLKMRVESLSTRMDFDERRARGREAVSPPAGPPRQAPITPPPAGEPSAPPRVQGRIDTPAGADGVAPGGEPRRRRRRRRRRRQSGEAQGPWQPQQGAGPAGSRPDVQGGPVEPESADDFGSASSSNEADEDDGPEPTDP